MNLRSKWDNIVAHNVYSKVAAGLILSLLGGIGTGIYAIIKNVSFYDAFKKATAFQLPVYQVLGFTILVFFAIAAIRQTINHAKTTNLVINELESEKLQSILSNNIITLSDKVFDSNSVDQDAFDGYGEKNWDNKQDRHIGNAAAGNFQFVNNFLIIRRQDLDGKFIIKIKSFYYNDPNRAFIDENLTGKNPRRFKYHFEARATKGQQRLTLVVRRHNSHKWLNNTEIVVDKITWQKYSGIIDVSCSENFIFEFQIHEIGKEPGGFQMKDLIFEEN